MPSPNRPLSRRSVLKGAGAAAAAALFSDGAPAHAASAPAKAPSAGKLRRISPEAAGVAPEAILAFIGAVEQSVGGLHSFMLLRDGAVTAEGWWAPYAPQYPHMLYSLSKSFTSTAVGLAIADGKLTTEDRVVSFFPDRLPPKVGDNLAAMRVRHLLTMNTGHDKDATGPVTAAADGDWVRAFLALPVEHAPASKFVYNSAATYMLSAIVQKQTGQRVVDYLKPRLFEPLGILGETWEVCPRGINTGGWGLSVKTEDIARFGQLYLQDGKWVDRQLVPAEWVAAATTKQVPNGDGGASDWTQGYGYQFWRCRHDAYRGDGAFGQYCVVMPEQNAVLVITSGVGDMQAVLNAVWDHLLPGIGAAPASGSDGAALRQRLAALAVHAPKGSPDSAAAAHVSGKSYRLDPDDSNIETAVFDFSPGRGMLTLRSANGEQQIASSAAGWTKGVMRLAASVHGLAAPPAGKIAARGAWTADDTYAMTVCYIETPFVETITCRFSGDDVTITRKMNVGFGPTERPPLVGHAV